MKHAMWGYLIIALGLVIIAVLMLVNNLTTADEEDFYIAREVMQSAMSEATDYGSYLTSGEVVMSREKFVEIFLRRFAESVTPNKNYQVDFYQIYEYPPAATVRIRTTTGTTNIKNDAINVDVDTILSAILVVGNDTSKYNIIDARDVLGLFGVSLNKSKTYRKSKSNCRSNCKASTNLESGSVTISGNNYLHIKQLKDDAVSLKSVTVIYKDGTKKNLTLVNNKWDGVKSNGLKTGQEFIAYDATGSVAEKKNEIDTIEVYFFRQTDSDKTKGNYMASFKYDESEAANITCVGGYKSDKE